MKHARHKLEEYPVLTRDATLKEISIYKLVSHFMLLPSFMHAIRTDFLSATHQNTRVMISILILCILGVASGHNVLLPSHGKICFFEQLRANDELSVSFQVGNRDAHSSDQLTADFWVSKVVPNLKLTTDDVSVRPTPEAAP